MVIPSLSKEGKKASRKLNLDPPATQPAPSEKELNEAIQGVMDLCKEATLPSFPDLSSEFVAKKISTLSFPACLEVECYCNIQNENALGYPECTVLRGGTKDRDYYIPCT